MNKHQRGYTFYTHEAEVSWGKVIYFIERGGAHGIGRLYAYSDDNYMAFIDSISVLPSFRNTGLGNAILDVLEQEAASLGYAFVSLWVEEGSWMEEWYRSKGYKYVKPYEVDGYCWMSKFIESEV